jgi:hypothetical protein
MVRIIIIIIESFTLMCINFPCEEDENKTQESLDMTREITSILMRVYFEKLAFIALSAALGLAHLL